MKILVTGANGYIGKRLLLPLVEKDHEVYALVRNKDRFNPPKCVKDQIKIIEADLLFLPTLSRIDQDFDVIYYLVHSMSENTKAFDELEKKSIQNLLKSIQFKRVSRLIYLTGLYPEKQKLSKHLNSRKTVEDIITASGICYTILRAGIVIGSGSASFEMMRDIVERTVIMFVPRWLESKCQPIAVYDVIYYLIVVAGHAKCKNQIFDIGGKQILTYKQMLLGYARVRKLRRLIIPMPFSSLSLSSLWIGFITAVNYSLVKSLVSSLINNTVCRQGSIHTLFDHKTLHYNQALVRALTKIEQNPVISSFRDSFVMSKLKGDLHRFVEVPYYGCLQIRKNKSFSFDKQSVINTVWSIGGKNGWFAYNWAWKIRGYIDQLFGGAGLGRGRKYQDVINVGDILDCWKTIAQDSKKGRLLLFSEMKVPGDAWLEFDIINRGEQQELFLCATFRPRGLLGRLYWYMLYPIHILIFNKMVKNIILKSNN